MTKIGLHLDLPKLVLGQHLYSTKINLTITINIIRAKLQNNACNKHKYCEQGLLQPETSESSVPAYILQDQGTR